MIHQINTLMPLLLEASGWAGGQPWPCQKAVLHPAGAVRGESVSLLLARAVPVLFSLELHREIYFQPQKNLPLLLEGISCDWLWCKEMKSRPKKTLKTVLDSEIQNEKYWHKKNPFFTPKMVFIKKNVMPLVGSKPFSRQTLWEFCFFLNPLLVYWD